jgi:hypothetical protein
MLVNFKPSRRWLLFLTFLARRGKKKFREKKKKFFGRVSLLLFILIHIIEHCLFCTNKASLYAQCFSEVLNVASSACKDSGLSIAVSTSILCRPPDLSRFCDHDHRRGSDGRRASQETPWTGVLREHWEPQVYRGSHGGSI